MPDRQASAPPPPPPGLAARRIAADIVDGVLRQKRPLDEQLEAQRSRRAARSRPRAGARASSRRCCAGSARCGICSAALLERGLPQRRRRSKTMLLIGAAQILFLDVPDHAAVDLSVRLAQADRHASHYSGLVNAVLRQAGARRQGAARRARHRDARHAGLADAALDRALRRGDRARHRRGAHATSRRSISRSKAMPQSWAEKLDGRVLPTGTVRTVAPARSRSFPATTRAHGGCRTPPPRCRRGCSATSRGKSRRRSLRRARRQDRAACARRRAGHRGRPLGAAARAAAAESGAAAARRRDRQGRRRRHGRAGRSTRVLVDAPCSSTGTIRRHPDIPWLKSEADLAKLVGPADPPARPRRRRCSSRAARWSIAPARSKPRRARSRSRRCSARNPALRRNPIAAGEVAGHAELLTADGELRTLPCHWARRRTRAWAGSTASTRPESLENLAGLKPVGRRFGLRYM